MEGEGVCVRVEKGGETFEGGCVCPLMRDVLGWVCEEKKWGRKICVRVQKREGGMYACAMSYVYVLYGVPYVKIFNWNTWHQKLRVWQVNRISSAVCSN